MNEKDPIKKTSVRRLTVSVPPGGEGQRVDRLVTNCLPDRSRTFIKRLIEQGYLAVDNTVPRTIVEPSYRVKPGEKFILGIPEVADLQLAGENIPLNIIFEDEELIVIDKPAGLVVHPAPGNQTGTLVNALIAHCGESLKGIGGVRRPGIVHRLDKDTSGLLVGAKTSLAHQSLVTQFSERTVQRAYIALVWGIPKKTSGLIDANIGRSPQNRKKMSVRHTGGREARTRYKVERIFSTTAACMLKCHLETGRTHQIRVHLAHIGHPIIGDPVYGGGITRSRKASLGNDALTATSGLNRQSLHAYLLGFMHPVTGIKHRFESVLPPELAEICAFLDGGGNSGTP